MNAEARPTMREPIWALSSTIFHPILQVTTILTQGDNQFKDFGGEVTITIEGRNVKVQWFTESLSDVDRAVTEAIRLLSGGGYRQAEPILSTLADRYPDHPDVLFNYGMMLSDQGNLHKAIQLLSRLTSIDSEHVNAWNALGVAYFRKGETEAAKRSLERSYRIDPENGYTLRNLGTILAKENYNEALPFLEKAAKLLPDDQQTQYGYALCLFQKGEHERADRILRKAIEISPYSEISELCRKERTKIAEDTMREASNRGLRMDVVMYCQTALETFNKVGPEQARKITAEIALLGRHGLDINNPNRKYTLDSLSGQFNGLELVSYMYTGLKQIDESMDMGMDFSKEYALAEDLFRQKLAGQ